VTPLTSDPLKKRSTFSSREDEISYFRELFSFVAVSCSCREWTRGIEDFALAFWLAPFQFRVVFFFFLYTHTHSLPSWFFFLLRGVVYCRALLSLSLAFLSSLDFYLNGESDHYSYSGTISSTENEAASELIGSFIPKVELDATTAHNGHPPLVSFSFSCHSSRILLNGHVPTWELELWHELDFNKVLQEISASEFSVFPASV
jgi:hypothetical protein